MGCQAARPPTPTLPCTSSSPLFEFRNLLLPPSPTGTDHDHLLFFFFFFRVSFFDHLLSKHTVKQGYAKFPGLFEVLRRGRGFLASIIDHSRKQKEKNEKQTYARTSFFLLAKQKCRFAVYRLVLYWLVSDQSKYKGDAAKAQASFLGKFKLRWSIVLKTICLEVETNQQQQQKICSDTQPVAQRDAELGLSGLPGKGFVFATLMILCPASELLSQKFTLKKPTGNYHPWPRRPVIICITNRRRPHLHFCTD